jgi:uncharacterized protein YqeY
MTESRRRRWTEPGSELDYLGFEPTGREPELPGYNTENAPMLGGERRLWSSVGAHLLAEQHRAHRAGNMERVWVIRCLRARIQQRVIQARTESWLTGEAPKPLSNEEALSEMIAERDVVIEELKQARHWLRPRLVAEHRRTLDIVNEYISYWQAHLSTLDRGSQNK